MPTLLLINSLSEPRSPIQIRRGYASRSIHQHRQRNFSLSSSQMRPRQRNEHRNKRKRLQNQRQMPLSPPPLKNPPSQRQPRNSEHPLPIKSHAHPRNPSGVPNANVARASRRAASTFVSTFRQPAKNWGLPTLSQGGAVSTIAPTLVAAWTERAVPNFSPRPLSSKHAPGAHSK